MHFMHLDSLAKSVNGQLSHLALTTPVVLPQNKFQLPSASDQVLIWLGEPWHLESAAASQYLFKTLPSPDQNFSTWLGLHLGHEDLQLHPHSECSRNRSAC